MNKIKSCLKLGELVLYIVLLVQNQGIEVILFFFFLVEYLKLFTVPFLMDFAKC